MRKFLVLGGGEYLISFDHIVSISQIGKSRFRIKMVEGDTIAIDGISKDEIRRQIINLLLI